MKAQYNIDNTPACVDFMVGRPVAAVIVNSRRRGDEPCRARPDLPLSITKILYFSINTQGLGILFGATAGLTSSVPCEMFELALLVKPAVAHTSTY